MSHENEAERDASHWLNYVGAWIVAGLVSGFAGMGVIFGSILVLSTLSGVDPLTAYAVISLAAAIPYAIGWSWVYSQWKSLNLGKVLIWMAALGLFQVLFDGVEIGSTRVTVGGAGPVDFSTGVEGIVASNVLDFMGYLIWLGVFVIWFRGSGRLAKRNAGEPISQSQTISEPS